MGALFVAHLKFSKPEVVSDFLQSYNTKFLQQVKGEQNRTEKCIFLIYPLWRFPHKYKRIKFRQGINATFTTSILK